MKGGNKEVVVNDRDIDGAIKAISLAMDIASNPLSKTSILKRVLGSPGASVKALKLKNKIQAEIGKEGFKDPNKIFESTIVQDLLKSEKLWKFISSRSDQIGAYLEHYKAQIEEALSATTPAENSLSPENIHELTLLLTSEEALGPICEVLAKNKDQIGELINADLNLEPDDETGKMIYSYKEGSVGDSLKKMGFEPSLLTKLLPVSTEILKNLPAHQRDIRDALQSYHYDYSLPKKEDKSLTPKFYDMISNVLFDERTGVAKPVLALLNTNPELAFELLEEFGYEQSLKDLGIDSNNPKHKDFVISLLGSITQELDKNSDSIKSLNNALTTIGGNQIQSRKNYDLAVNLQSLAFAKTDVGSIIIKHLQENLDVAVDIAKANPDLAGSLQSYGVDLNNPQEVKALKPIVKSSLDFVSAASSNKKEGAYFLAAVREYSFKPSGEGLSRLLSSFAALELNDAKAKDALHGILSAESIAALKPYLIGSMQNNPLALELLGNDKIIKDIESTYLKDPQLRALLEAVQDLSSQNIMQKILEKDAALNTGELLELYGHAVNIMQSSETKAFIEGNDEALSKLISAQIQGLIMEDADKKVLSDSAGLILKVATIVANNENLAKLSGIKSDLGIVMNENIENDKKAANYQGVILAVVSIIEKDDFQAMLRNDKEQLVQLIELYLPQAVKDNGISSKAVVSLLENPKVTRELKALANDPNALASLISVSDKISQGQSIKGGAGFVKLLFSSPALRTLVNEVRKEREKPLQGHEGKEPQDERGVKKSTWKDRFRRKSVPNKLSSQNSKGEKQTHVEALEARDTQRGKGGIIDK